MKLEGYWRTEENWVCQNHCPSIILSHLVENCPMSNCGCRRPKKIKEEVISNIIKEASLKCNYYKCSNNKLDGRKYCSNKCRKDRARELYRIRKKLEKKRELDKLKEIKILEDRIKLLKQS